MVLKNCLWEQRAEGASISLLNEIVKKPKRKKKAEIVADVIRVTSIY